jgi:hypothetical protein
LATLSALWWVPWMVRLWAQQRETQWLVCAMVQLSEQLLDALLVRPSAHSTLT